MQMMSSYANGTVTKKRKMALKDIKTTRLFKKVIAQENCILLQDAKGNKKRLATPTLM